MTLNGSDWGLGSVNGINLVEAEEEGLAFTNSVLGMKESPRHG